AGTRFTGAGTARLLGSATLLIPTGASISASNFEQSAGVLDGGGTLGVTSLLNWTGGTVMGTGVTNVSGSFVLAGNTKTFTQRTISNAGAATWSAGIISVGQEAGSDNNGTLANVCDRTYTFNLGGTAGATFNNPG